MIKFSIICVGKLKEEYTKKALADYCLRLSKYGSTDIVEVPESDIPGEGQALLKKLPDRAYVIALDLHGKMMDSEKFAALLAEKTVAGFSHFAFVIGGSDGISPEVTARADLRLCLSRAMKINAGETYHK